MTKRIFILLCCIASIAMIMSVDIVQAAANRTVRVGVYQNAPKIFQDENGKASGFFIDLLEAIGDAEGWTISYTTCEWADCLAALENGEIDLMPDVAYSSERDQKFDFHRTPAAESWSQVYTNKSLAVSDFSDLDGRRVAVLQDSIQQTVFVQMMNSFGFKATIVPVTSLEDAFAAAASGSADAAIVNHFFGDYFYEKYGLVKTTVVFNLATLFFATAQGRNADLLKAIDSHLVEWIQQSDSPYYTILNRWTQKEPAYLIPPSVYWSLIITVVLFATAVGLILLLRRQVRIRTLHLEQVNQALRESEQRYQLISAVASDYVFSSRLDAEGQLMLNWAAGAFEKITGYTLEEYIAHGGWRGALHPEDKDIDDRDIKILQSNRPLITELRTITRQGKVVWVRVYAHPVIDHQSGRLVSIYGAVQDITARKNAEIELQQQAKELTALNSLGQQISQTLSVDQVISISAQELMRVANPDMIFLFLQENEELNLKAFEPSAQMQNFGALPEHRIGANLCSLALHDKAALYLRDVRDDHRCQWEDCKLIETRSFAALPLRSGDDFIGVIGLAANQERDFESQATFLETLVSQVAAGIRNATLYHSIQQYAGDLEVRVADRTRELETAKIRAESADRLKSAFLATMSHELRTPLNSIIGFTGILLMGLGGPLSAEQEKQLTMIQDSARHLLELINDVLDISKIEAGQIELAQERFDLRQSIQKSLEKITPLANQKGLALSVEIAPAVGQIAGDRRRVEQILLNLLNNAVKFTEKGEVAIHGRLEDGNLIIQISDTGIGIRPEDIETLFKPFRQVDIGITRQYEGTGLGLSICKRLVEMMGGRIWIESEKGKGSTFAFSLPLERINI